MAHITDNPASHTVDAAGVRLTVREKISYGFGDAGGTIVTGLISNFLTFFYTDIFGLTPAIVGSMFLILRVVDAISDPLIGVLADRNRSSKGQFRPFIFWTALPLGLILFLTFTVPNTSSGWKIAYAAFTYFGLSLLYSLNNVPYCALITRLTTNPQEMISCQSYRFVLCGIAGFIVSVGLPVMVAWSGHGDQAKGYHLGVAGLATLAVAMFLICYGGVKERVNTLSTHVFNLKDSLNSVRKNDQLILTFIMSLLLISIFNTKGGAALYFITYVLHGDAEYTSLFFGLATCGGIAGSFLVTFFTRRFELNRIYLVVNILLAVAHYCVWFVPAGYTTFWLVLVFICCVILGFLLPMHFTLVAFADRYGEWKSGTRASGMSFAFNLFFVKLAWAVAGVIISVTLSLVSYRAGLEHQTSWSLNGIKLLSTVIPGVLHMLLALTVYFFRINNAMEEKMRREMSSFDVN